MIARITRSPSQIISFLILLSIGLKEKCVNEPLKQARCSKMTVFAGVDFDRLHWYQLLASRVSIAPTAIPSTTRPGQVIVSISPTA